jgi:3D (Asp-Asp-Asp) domain-containing protein
LRKILISVVLTSILTITGSYLYYQDLLESSYKTVSKLEEDQKLKSAEIAKLEDVVKSKDEELKANEKVISSQKTEMNKMVSKINSLEDELSKYDSLRQLDIVATAYTAFCNTGCTGVTAKGTNVANTVYKSGYRVVAVDPKVIPLGSLVYVESEDRSFIGIADDTGGDIKGRRMDVLVRNKSIAYNFGKQDAKVTVIREGEG